jgi:hypothetical protein
MAQGSATRLTTLQKIDLSRRSQKVARRPSGFTIPFNATEPGQLYPLLQMVH